MSWNHRVMVERIGDEALFSIREVYYDEKGEIEHWSSPMDPFGESLEELRGDLELMLAALEKPVIEASDLVSDDAEESGTDLAKLLNAKPLFSKGNLNERQTGKPRAGDAP